MDKSLPIRLLTPTATMPTYGSAGAAGLDLYADLLGGDVPEGMEPGTAWTEIDPGDRLLVKTGVAMAIPVGLYGRIAPRSGLALKHGIEILGGVVDDDYRGDVGVILLNNGDAPFRVEHGMRIAQMVLEYCARLLPVAVEELAETSRSAGGFGSTGS